MKLARVLLIMAVGLAGISLVGLASRGQNTTAAQDDEIMPLENQVNQFLEGVSLGQLDAAYDELLADSPMLRRAESLAELKEKTKDLPKRFGRYLSFERIGARRLGRDVVLLKYLYKCEQFPVAWYITFYRAAASDDALSTNPSWKVIAVRFDTQIELLAMTN